MVPNDRSRWIFTVLAHFSAHLLSCIPPPLGPAERRFLNSNSNRSIVTLAKEKKDSVD